MALSSKSLFHFSSYENIVSILLSKYFRVSYCREALKFRQSYSSYFFPMVCFCDIPLTMTKNHVEHYDGFAIGLKKEWAIAHGLNPVFYMNEMGLTVTMEKLSIVANSDEDGKTGFEHIICFLKQIKGYDYKTKAEKYFYDEKEWRFVPMLSLFTDSYEQFYSENNFPDELNVKITGHRLYKLGFNVSDVEYIIVKTKDKKQDMIDILMDSEYSEAIIQNTIRVFSMQEIYENF